MEIEGASGGMGATTLPVVVRGAPAAASTNYYRSLAFLHCVSSSSVQGFQLLTPALKDVGLESSPVAGECIYGLVPQSLPQASAMMLVTVV